MVLTEAKLNFRYEQNVSDLMKCQMIIFTTMDLGTSAWPLVKEERFSRMLPSYSP